MNFPRYMFVVGGAGKGLFYTMFEKEWILKEILKPQFSPTSIDITIIDTAIDEENEDRERIKKIESHIKKLEDEYRSNIGEGEEGRTIGKISIYYMLLTKDMILQSPYDLIGIGKEVKRATGAEVWWINDKEKLGEEWQKKVMSRENFKELNFTKGVYRKRAIGKAIYYKAVSEGKFDIDLLQTAQVDILVGLGGGTGSGMAFDLAKKLKSIQPTADITLFGVMSTLDESPDEKANNFAMISEIEYGYLNKDTPFKDIIFIPMEITRYPGRERASDEHERLLREFDETIPYVLMAYHNNPAQLFFAGVPGFAPFIIATSQLVRYNVASIKRLKDKLIDAFNNKDASLKDEEDIYMSIKRFVDEFYADIIKNGQLPDEDKTFIKDDRYSKFTDILRHKFFKELDYNSVKYLQRAVDEGISGVVGASVVVGASGVVGTSGAGADGTYGSSATSGATRASNDESLDIGKQISSIKVEIETISIGEDGYKEDADLRLHKILKKDIEVIEVIKDLLDVVNKIPDNIVRDTLKTIIKADEYSLGRKMNQLRKELDTINGKKKQAESKAKSLEEEISAYDTGIRKDIDKYNKEWNDGERRYIESIENLDTVAPALGNDIAILKDELDKYAARISSLNNVKNIDIEPTRNIEDIVSRISQKFENVGIFYSDKNAIVNSLSSIKWLKKAHIDSKKKIPIIDKALGIVIKTDRIKKQKDAKNNVMLKITELNTLKIFEARESPNLSISLIYQCDVETILASKRADIINGIVKRTQEKFPSADTKLLSYLKGILSNPVQRKSINIEDIVKSNIGYTGDIQKRRDFLRERRAEIEKMTYDINRLRSLEVILKNNTPAVKKHSNGIKDFHTKIANIEKDVVAMYGTAKDAVRYIMEMQPANIYKATLTGSNINNILTDKDEVANLKQNLTRGLERTIDNRYNVLLRRVIESSDNMIRWDKTKVMNTFVTIANISPDDIDARRIVTNAFSVSNSNYSQWVCPSGDIWEVGIVLFIAGVPLDNIRNVTDPRAGYRRNYEQVSESEMIFFHHSYMLERGKFVDRIKVFNIEDEKDKLLFLQNDRDVRTTFLQNYEKKYITECVKDDYDETRPGSNAVIEDSGNEEKDEEKKPGNGEKKPGNWEKKPGNGENNIVKKDDTGELSKSAL